MSLQKISADRFSSLPDDILIHILSFLPTKQAIVASILSKRWTNLWRAVPILNFINTKVNSKEDNCRFIQFIKTNFLSREEASTTSHSIHTFLLNIQYDLANYDLLISLTYINNWIKHVVEHNNVQYLSLQLQMHCRYPTSIFSSRTLIVLKLQTINVDDVSPSPSRFPSLKTLHLNDIRFNKYSDFMLLLDGCPVLEDLQISYLDIVKSIDQFDFEHFENSSSLRKLNKAYISDLYCQFPMKVVSNLEFLHLKLYQDYLFNDFPTFHNLTHLAVNYDCDLAVHVLQHCPKLQNLELYRNFKYARTDEYRTDEYIAKDDQELGPRCLSSSLTTCTIRDFASSTLESLIMLVRFIMNKARVLETMTIWSDVKHFSEIERQLSSCPRASATCQLSIQLDIDDTPSSFANFTYFEH